MCNSHDLDSSLTKTVHDEERKAMQEDAPTALKIGSTRLRAFGNPVYRRIKFTAKTRCSSLVAFPVPPLGGFGSSAANGWNSTANWDISARRVGGGPLPREWF
jgi:hypothetical protein